MSLPEAPASAPPDARAAIALQLAEALARKSLDFNAVIRLGGAARELGMAAEADAAFRAAVAILLAVIRAGDAENALAAEGAIYHAFVRSVEIEDHYERSFAQWREPMAALGRTFQVPMAATASRRIGFVFPTGVVLGHTEVLLRLLESRDRALDVRLYVFGKCNRDFLERASALQVAVEVFPEWARWGGATLGFVPRLKWLREQMARDATTTAVWVSAPVPAIFAFAMRLAPVQVFWALRYHAVRIPEIDGYLTYGSWQERERVFHGQRWTVCPVPLALDPRLPAAAEVAALRARFPEPVLLGTLAREEKIDSRPFLETVAAILERNPQCGFLWTGQAQHAGITEFFRARGLAQRCHFVGWVDTRLYAAALDVFLETFPLGCGITGYQALAAGVPLVSVAYPNTVFGMQYWSELMEKAGTAAHVTREMLDAYPVLCARDGAEYVDLVSRLVADESFRGQWKAREARFFAEEIAGIARYSRRFFDAIGAVTDQALAR